MLEKKEMRFVYRDTLESLLESDQSVFSLDADLVNCIMTTHLYTKFPEQTLNCGISEANMVSAASGLAISGLKPFAHTFAPFMTRRALDQLYMSVFYSNNPVYLYGSEPGIYSQANGGTHCSIEDFSVLRAFPNVTIFAPSDPTSFAWSMKEYVKNPAVLYARAPRAALPYIYNENETFEIGKAKYLHKGKKIAIIAIGDRVHNALEAKEELLKQGIDVSVVDLLFVKPYDQKLVQEILKEHDYIITYENHNIYGGIGDLIASEIATSDCTCKLIKMGIPDTFVVHGTLPYLEEKYHISTNDVIQTVLNIEKN